jgi:hypothetical protein
MTKTPEAKSSNVRMMVTPVQYNLIYSDSTGIVIDCKIPIDQDLHQQLATTKAKLELALGALDFYGNIKSYHSSVYKVIRKEDLTLNVINYTDMEDIYSADGYKFRSGGKLAREIKKQIKEIK